MTDKNKRQEHLGDLSRDFAVFLPAISNFYNTFISKQRITKGEHIPLDRVPESETLMTTLVSHDFMYISSFLR